MLDNITSLFDNYKGKIRNPFIGTIISVWLIHNWRIPYALFTFDEDRTMQCKINYITDYFQNQDFWWELGKIIFISFLILTFTFILMAFSRILTDSYYKVLEPFLITLIDKKAIYTKDEKIKLENKILELENILNSKREEITRTEQNNSFMQIGRDKIQAEFDSYIKSKTEEYNHLKQKMDDLVKKFNFADKVLNKYDDIIHLLTAEEKAAIESIINSNKDLSGIITGRILEKTFLQNGFMLPSKERIMLNEAGRLFLEYYKNFPNARKTIN